MEILATPTTKSQRFPLGITIPGSELVFCFGLYDMIHYSVMYSKRKHLSRIQNMAGCLSELVYNGRLFTTPVTP